MKRKESSAALTLPGCPVCLDDVAVPPVLLLCGHFLCGGCYCSVCDASIAHPERKACPVCRTPITGYVVSSDLRAQALAVATDEQCAANDAFTMRFPAHANQPMPLASHGPMGPSSSSAASHVSRFINASSTGANNKAAAKQLSTTILALVPKVLSQGWVVHSYDDVEFRHNIYDIPDVSCMVAPEDVAKTRSAALGQVRAVCKRAGITVRFRGCNVSLTLPFKNRQAFITMKWPVP